ncbi:MAG: dTDP-4-dehydrorhamnose 3,5-epimerase family protein [Hyphomicrobiales bacterium]|nr:dTDP-4-dehydrorhamnose 3,5-epimerase family protein [Hyphomicrobiales bacterium]MDE2115584.1 dTDP-4-dehydrorhamnose 3,5-epimerase family protein [Hyphomicrobiales bacterium]
MHNAYIVDVDSRVDERGSFNRVFCPDEFAAAHIAFAPTQVNLAQNPHALTMRGMHFNRPPYEEAKFVRCVRGSVYDVAIDIRRDSPTYRRWIGVELTAKNMRALMVPAGCAHGYLTLEPESDFLYLMSRNFTPGVDSGLRYNDPAFGVIWPQAPLLVHPRDANYPDFIV